ncbi:MAG: DUF5683 domain-containing protein [Phocaeicola sp.]|nr:DUF5683 domain-containing protein [Phocaeicola sp.]
MKSRFIKYLTYIVACISVMLLMYPTEMQAQRALKHRQGLLKNDSVNTKKKTEATDSLIIRSAEKDSVSLDKDSLYTDENLRKIESLEAPIDTAMLSMKSDSIMQQSPVKQKKRWIPDSNKSVWMAMVLPGAGQIYNRKYWKLPIIYGGFVGCAYALTWNTKMYNDYSQAYIDIMSDNPANDSYKDFIPSYIDIESNKEYYQNLFKNAKDAYRRQRDLSIFAFIGVYLLSVIDAYVDAELSDFDISKDLSMKLEPTVFNDVYRKRPQGIGLQCNIKF